MKKEGWSLTVLYIQDVVKYFPKMYCFPDIPLIYYYQHDIEKLKFVGSLWFWRVNKNGYICFIDIVSPGSYQYHWKEIRVCKFLYNEPFHIKPL